MDQNFLLQLELQVGIPLVVGLVGIGLAWVKQRLNLQADSTAAQLMLTANTTLQNAAENFAGKIAPELAKGNLTQSQAVQQLGDYLKTEVAGAFATAQPTQAALTTMLLGKVAKVAGVNVPGMAKPPVFP